MDVPTSGDTATGDRVRLCQRMRSGLDYGRGYRGHLFELWLADGPVPSERLVRHPPWRADVDFTSDSPVRGGWPEIIPFDFEARAELKHPQAHQC